MENVVNQENFSSSYRNKKVFITGHTGFKGSWLMAMLKQSGAIIKGYALESPDKKDLFNIIWNKHVAENIIADIRDKKKLQDEIFSFQPDFIFHLAAQPLVRRSYQIPSETFEVNVVGTANLLESLIGFQKKCSCIIITTDKVYQNMEQDILYNENDALGGYDPYSASKACTEFTVDSFRNSFFNIEKLSQHKKAIASVRAGNVIGGGDWNNDRLVPDIIRSLENKKEIKVRNPESVRPWQHVLEPLGGYLLLGGLLDKNPDQFSEAFNFGPFPDDHLRVKDLVATVIEKWGSGVWKDISYVDAPHEAGLLKLDITKAKQKLGWQPKLNTRLAIDWMVQWYQQPHHSKEEFTYRQIKEYLYL